LESPQKKAEANSTSSVRRVAGMIAHTELASTDPKAARVFLEKVFEWRFQSAATPQGELLSYETPGGTLGSIRKTQPQELPVSLNYVLVEDLNAAEKKILSSGGEIVLPRVDVPHMGSFFWFKVPGGPVLACWADAPDRRV
jgi:predicted enzyme related to lactoylglutathione lyase